jgi:hypothetical protein
LPKSENSLKAASACCRRRQWFAVLSHNFQALIDYLAQFGLHLSFVVAVATLTNDSRALADETLILIGPFNDLDISSAVVHDRGS